jgi:hypothetical protein
LEGDAWDHMKIMNEIQSLKNGGSWHMNILQIIQQGFWQEFFGTNWTSTKQCLQGTIVQFLTSIAWCVFR